MTRVQIPLSGYGHIFDVEERIPAAQQAAERLRMLAAKHAEKRADFYDWAIRVPEPKSGNLDFDRFPFQRELYSQSAYDPEVVIKKSTQVGISAYLVRWTIFFADTRGQVALYLFPKERQLRDFSDARVRPLLQTDYLRTRISAASINNKMYKAIGLGSVYYRGSEATAGLESVDADALALDEYDFLVPANIPQAEHRLDGSLDPKIRRVGFPTVPGYGIANFFSESDQRHWNVKCEGCNEWQDIDFWENVDMEAARVVCRKCRKPLDVRKGEWVAKFPERSSKGYHVPRLIVPTTDVKKIIKESKATLPHHKTIFYNRALGLEYADASARISPETIASCQRDFELVEEYRGGDLVTMGVDVASARALSVRISRHLENGKKQALWIGEVNWFGGEADCPEHETTVYGLMRAFDVNMACIDHLPEQRMARGFAEEFRGRVYLVSYSATQAKVLEVKEEEVRVVVRRTEAIDAVGDMLRKQQNLLPATLPPGYVTQLGAPVRFVEIDEVGKIQMGYRTPAGAADDYLHAEVYDMVATEAWWVRQQVEDAQNDVEQPLDNLMPFDRSTVTDGEDVSYRPGPGFEAPEDDIYRP